MKISITLPSIYANALARTLANIHATSVHPLEVLVVSPNEPPLDSRGHMTVVWIKEDQPRGCAAAHQEAMRRATGDVIAAWADDHLFLQGWDSKALENFVERERRFHSGATGGSSGVPFCLGLRHDVPHDAVGTVFGIYYPYFPMMRLGTVRQIGWIGADYRAGFGDSDLGMRVWAAGGRCEFSRERLVSVHEDDQRKVKANYTESDLRLFVKRWKSRYGKGWDTDQIRGFNFDVAPENTPQLVKEYSYWVNDPSFAQTVAPSLPPYLIETIDNTNIVWFRCKYHTVPQGLGPVDLAAEEHCMRAGVESHATLSLARCHVSRLARRRHRWWDPRRWSIAG